MQRLSRNCGDMLEDVRPGQSNPGLQPVMAVTCDTPAEGGVSPPKINKSVAVFGLRNVHLKWPVSG